MDDIRNMFTNMTGDAQALAAGKTIEEHIPLHPDNYIGSVERADETMWIYDTKTEKMVEKKISYVPDLYKFYDHILVNTADNKRCNKNIDCIKVEINPDANVISVWINSLAIPVEIYEDENVNVPTMIFGFLVPSSNYNGCGAKLTIETGSLKYKRRFKQTWHSNLNMSRAYGPEIEEFCCEDFTKVTFSPDLTKFKMKSLDDDIVGLMSRRAFDIAATTCGVNVFLNGKRLPVNNFKDYIDLYIEEEVDDSGNPLKVIHEIVNDSWEVALTISPTDVFEQVSFVNGIATTKGGKHVDYVTDIMVKQLLEILNKKNKSGTLITPTAIKNYMWVFVNCVIVNPTFDSPTKETMTLQSEHFRSQCNFSQKFVNLISECGIVEAVLAWSKRRDTLRLKRRKDYLEGLFKAEASKLSNQARFIMEKCNGELVVENKKRKMIDDELIMRQYPPDPVKEWKRRHVEVSEEDEEEETSDENFNYLLEMSISMLTEERKHELLRQRDAILSELDERRRLSLEDIWRKDLNV